MNIYYDIEAILNLKLPNCINTLIKNAAPSQLMVFTVSGANGKNAVRCVVVENRRGNVHVQNNNMEA